MTAKILNRPFVKIDSPYRQQVFTPLIHNDDSRVTLWQRTTVINSTVSQTLCYWLDDDIKQYQLAALFDGHRVSGKQQEYKTANYSTLAEHLKQDY